MKTVALNARLSVAQRQCVCGSRGRHGAMKCCIEAGKLWHAGISLLRDTDHLKFGGEMERRKVDCLRQYPQHLSGDCGMFSQVRPPVYDAVPNSRRPPMAEPLDLHRCVIEGIVLRSMSRGFMKDLGATSILDRKLTLLFADAICGTCKERGQAVSLNGIKAKL